MSHIGNSYEFYAIYLHEKKTIGYTHDNHASHFSLNIKPHENSGVIIVLFVVMHTNHDIYMIFFFLFLNNNQ